KSLPPELLEAHLLSVIKVLRTSGPKAMTHCKNLIFDISNKLTLEEAVVSTAKMIAEIRASDEGQEGMDAFLNKRKPDWVGE
ncbi:MAG: enoyl-CoA hydratase, partial [Bacteroidetes bacterium 4572_114]